VELIKEIVDSLLLLFFVLFLLNKLLLFAISISPIAFPSLSSSPLSNLRQFWS